MGRSARLLRSARMSTKYTPLELAVNALVRGFYSQTKDGCSTLDKAAFQPLVSKQLPNVAKSLGEEGALDKLLQQMGVEDAQSISFENFWTLVRSQADQHLKEGLKEKVVRCTCTVF